MREYLFTPLRGTESHGCFPDKRTSLAGLLRVLEEENHQTVLHSLLNNVFSRTAVSQYIVLSTPMVFK